MLRSACVALLLLCACRNAPADRHDGPGARKTPTELREDAGAAGTTAPGPAPDESGQCTGDADCGVSRFIPGQCCEDCSERAVLRSRLAAQNEACAEELARCPVRNCAPGSMGGTATCVEGRCVMRGSAR